MLKYTILYKNGKTWNGKANNLADVPVHNDAVLLVAKNSAGSIIYMIGQYGGWSSVPTTFRRAKRRTPNPNSKTKKQKAFDQAYLEWTMEHFAKYDNCPSVKEYKKWLWEQKNEKVVKVDKDGFIPWNGGEMPVAGNVVVDLKFRDGGIPSKPRAAQHYYWKHGGDRSDIVAYKVVEEGGIYTKLQQDVDNLKKSHSFFNVYNAPIKSTYTFWLGANGEIVDDKRT